MKIDYIEVENYKCFEKLEFQFENLSIFVGENNAGKSAIFSAIDKFFDSSNKSSPITKSDFFVNEQGERSKELRILIRFSKLSEKAIETFSEYTSSPSVTFQLTSKLNGEMVSTNISGIRRGMEEFSNAFSYAKVTPVSKFNEEYSRLQKIYNELPLPNMAKNKELKLEALRSYETSRPDSCVDIISGDDAYGTIGPVPNLKGFLKWIFIPAVKDASDEANEGRNILSEIVSFAARRQTNFDERIEIIQSEVSDELDALRRDQQSALDSITIELNNNFSEISMGKETLELSWEHSKKDLKIEPPKAAAKIISGQHKGPIGLFGHGLQRNYLVSLFKVIATMQIDETDDLTLVVAFEEPELYQHPPQARLMSRYLYSLANHDQVFITTHSSMFIHADFFGKLHRVVNEQGKTNIVSVSLEQFTKQMASVYELPIENIHSTASSLYTLINLSITEVFFSRFVVLVEGLEDIGYLEAVTDHYEKRSEILEHGINFIPVHGKNDITPIVELCKAFKIPFFIIFDCDGNHEASEEDSRENREKSASTAKSNKRLFKQIEFESDNGFVSNPCLGKNFQLWKENIRADILSENPEFQTHLDKASSFYAAKVTCAPTSYHFLVESFDCFGLMRPSVASADFGHTHAA